MRERLIDKVSTEEENEAPWVVSVCVCVFVCA